MQRPKRKLEIEIQIGANDWRGVEKHLKDLLLTLAECGCLVDGYCVGGESARNTFVNENPEMTPEKYREAMDSWVKENH